MRFNFFIDVFEILNTTRSSPEHSPSGLAFSYMGGWLSGLRLCEMLAHISVAGSNPASPTTYV